METVEISGLAERVRKFLSVNRKATLNDIKLHLGCRGTDLLIASGWLVNENQVEITRDGGSLWVSLKK